VNSSADAPISSGSSLPNLTDPEVGVLQHSAIFVVNEQARGKEREILTSILVAWKGRGHTRKRGWLDVSATTCNSSDINPYDENAVLCCDLRKSFDGLRKSWLNQRMPLVVQMLNTGGWRFEHGPLASSEDLENYRRISLWKIIPPLGLTGQTFTSEGEPPPLRQFQVPS